MYMYYKCGSDERHYFYYYKINVRENRRGNQQWTIQRHWYHWEHKIQDEDKRNKKYNTAQKTKQMSTKEP